MKSTSSVFMKLIVAWCLCLGAVASLSAQSINFTITGSIGSKPLSGTDPIGLAGSPYTVTTSVNAVGKPFASGQETYTGLTVNITATPAILGQPTSLSCTGATATVTAGAAGDQINLTNCNISVAGLSGSFSASTTFPTGTFPSPIPLAFNGNMLSTSTTSYSINGMSTEFNITGNTAAVCSGCSTLALNPASVTLNGQVGGTAQTQTVTVGTSSPLLAFADSTTGSSWLTVSPAGGQTGGTITVTATPGALAAGSYSGTVKVYTAASNSPISLPVTFNVSSPSFSLTASPNPMAFSAVAGQSAPSQSLSVTASNSSSVAYTASASSTGNWLSLNTSSGTTGGTPLSVSVNTTGLTTGVYSGSVTITSSGATNSPLVVPVTLSITAPSMVPAPSTLSFASTSGAVPASQTIGLTSSAPSAPISYTVAASTTGGGNWLTVSPASNGTTPGLRKPFPSAARYWRDWLPAAIPAAWFSLRLPVHRPLP